MGEPDNSKSFLPGTFNVNSPIKHPYTYPMWACEKIGGDLTFLKGGFPYCGAKFSD